MKKLTTIGVTAVGLLLSCAPLAVADSTPSPRASENLDAKSYKSALEKYQTDHKNYADLIKTNEDKRRLANQVFKVAMQKIMSEAKSAKGAANSPDLKRQAMAARQNAIVAASAARDLAHAEIGPSPTPPVEPIKPGIDARANPPDQGALDTTVKPSRERKGKNR